MWTESFKCNICGKQRTSFANDWWIAWTDDVQPADNEPRRLTGAVSRDCRKPVVEGARAVLGGEVG